jgi:hypothetical protein
MNPQTIIIINLKTKTMKKITTKLIIAGIVFLTIGKTTNAQNWLQQVIVEPYYLSDANDNATTSSLGIGTLPIGSKTYRVWVDMLPGKKFQALYGVTGHALTIQSTTCFYNNEDRGATTPSYTKAQANGNSIMVDSWFSGGGASSNRMAVMKSDDDGLANVVNASAMLINTAPWAGIPLTTQDGFYSGTTAPGSVTFVGLTTELDVFGSVNCVGNSFTTSNGSVAVLGGISGVDTTNKVLVGQFTTDGDFCFFLNIQIGDGAGGVQNYVWDAPGAGEITIPSLTYCSTVSVKTPPEKKDPSVNLYPNPANDFVKIDITSYDKTKNNSYKVMNVLGETVLQSAITSNQATIDIEQLQSGMYFVEFNLDGMKITKKVIKK